MRTFCYNGLLYGYHKGGLIVLGFATDEETTHIHIPQDVKGKGGKII